MVKATFVYGVSEDAKAIRKAVFVDEQGVVNEFDEYDSCCWTLVLYYNDAPIATGRICKEDPETYHVGRVAVLKPYRRMKIGSYVMKYLQVKAKELGARKLILNAQVSALPFYRSLGYKEEPYGEVFMEEGIPHMAMYKILPIRKRR